MPGVFAFTRKGTDMTTLANLSGGQSARINGIQADYASLPFTSYRYEIAQQALASLEQMEDKQLHISLAHVPPSASFIQAA